MAMKSREQLSERLLELRNAHYVRMYPYSPEQYRNLNYEKKAPLMILMAELTAYQEAMSGIDLNRILVWCVKNEQYCGAAGIKKALEWIENESVTN